MPDLARLRDRLASVGQDHVLRFVDELDAARRGALLAQIQSLDLAALPDLVERFVKHPPAPALPKDLRPAPYYPADAADAARPWDASAARARGEALIKSGKVAAFVVAGGQGSRLGYDGPKGCFPAGAVTRKSLFQIFAENLLWARDRYGVRVPWYIMTSPLNHEATTSFFEANKHFGLDAADVRFFPQGVMPSLSISDGRMLLADKHEIATNPDGHGGCIRALHVSGAIADLIARGVEHLSYFQVDNPHVKVLDPLFLGLHAGAPDSSAEMSSKMVRKTDPAEKVGVFCLADGRTEVIEYSDMPAALANQRHANGSIAFDAGSIAIHIIGVSFLEKLATNPSFSLPFHRAEKKVPCVDLATGEKVSPSTNNAVKLERFVFDALALAQKSIVVETDRVEEFAPIKNASGVDSVESSARLQTARAARWLEACGVSVPRRADASPDCVLEISPRTANGPEDLRHAKLPKVIEPGQVLAL
ncbi:MAG: UDPGP type 1 family protein [Planctomycetota bacterium]|nr:UDPGP type 1 family protein [Planctomycetota bacterium]